MTISRIAQFGLKQISTHILTRRMTCLRLGRKVHRIISTHILTRRMTRFLQCGFNCVYISTHILTRRMTSSSTFNTAVYLLFQLTSSQGGWRWGITRPFRDIFHFNSHPHKEDDLRIPCTWDRWSHFNSHPHKEDDSPPSKTVQWWCISTHILTRRMTKCHILSLIVKIISTHILTRRMTCLCLCDCWKFPHFNSHPHKEDDDYRRFHDIWVLEFQLTSSQGGWQEIREI